MMATVRACRAMLWRDIKRYVRRRQEVVRPVIFFVIVVTLFSIAVGPDNSAFAELAPAVTWVAILLATMISLDAIFTIDHDDGVLEALVLSTAYLPALVTAKVSAHWLATALPQILTALILAALFGFKPAVIIALAGTLVIGSWALTLIGAIASALTIGLRGGGLLIALITLPLYIPTLIFATSAVHNAARGLEIAAEMYFLGGLALLALTLAPFGIAAALRIRLG